MGLPPTFLQNFAMILLHYVSRSSKHGKYQNENNVLSVTCKSCNAGRFASSKSVGCQACSTGTFQDQAAATTYECSYCAKGAFFVNTVSSCKGCTTGKFQDSATTASAQCKFCAQGEEYSSTISSKNYYILMWQLVAHSCVD